MNILCKRSMQQLALQLPTTDENLILSYAALCHDLGKVSTTILKDGVLKSPGHAEAGVPYTSALLKRITQESKNYRNSCAACSLPYGAIAVCTVRSQAFCLQEARDKTCQIYLA